MACSSKFEEDTQKILEREIRNMVSTLMQRLTRLQCSTKRCSSHRLDDDGERGPRPRAISLEGSNTGAIMRAGLRERLEGRAAFSDDEGMQRTPGAYANSSYQAVNNSIMMNGRYSAQDPGIHNVFGFDGHDHEEDNEKLKREMKKKKKKKNSNSDSSDHEEDSRSGYREEKNVQKGRGQDLGAYETAAAPALASYY